VFTIRLVAELFGSVWPESPDLVRLHTWPVEAAYSGDDVHVYWEFSTYRATLAYRSFGKSESLSSSCIGL